MLTKIPIHKILFLDIETVPQFYDWNQLDEKTQQLWEKKTSTQRKELSDQYFYPKRAGILAEFGKIICVSCGGITKENKFRIKSFFGDDEKVILADFADLLNRHYSPRNSYLCAHNGKEFDFPYLGRRMLINGISLPKCLQIQGMKPWNIPHLDTMELWRFGDYKHYTSLDLLTKVFNIPTPKQEIDGSMVAKVYYEEKNLDLIRRYCEGDVLAVAQIFRRFRNEPLLELE